MSKFRDDYLDTLTRWQLVAFAIGLTIYVVRASIYVWEITYLAPFFGLFAPPGAMLDYLKGRLFAYILFVKHGVDQRYIPEDRLDRWRKLGEEHGIL
jgi:hypothetical protein